MDDHPRTGSAEGHRGKPDAGVDVTSTIAGHRAEILRLIDLPSVPSHAVEFTLQRLPATTTQATAVYRLVVYGRKTANNTASEIGSLHIDFRRGRIGTIVLSENELELLDGKRKLMPAQSACGRAWQMVARLWEHWSFSDRPVCLKIADIREILQRHDQERRKANQRSRFSLTTLAEYWESSRMLIDLLSRHYSHLGANQREKLHIRWYLLQRAGYIRGGC